MVFRNVTKHCLYFHLPYTSFCLPVLMFLLFLGPVNKAEAQTTVRGFVRDSITGKALTFADVRFEGSEKAQRTNINGFFEIIDTTGIQTIVITLKDYTLKKIPVTVNQITALDILLPPKKDDLDLLTQKSRKEKYKNDNSNPAIALIQNVIANKNKDRIEDIPAYQFERYEKMILSVDDVLKTLKSNKTLKKFESAYNDLEISDFTGKPILTISTKEILADEYRKNDPETKKSIIVAERHEGVDRATLTQSLTGIWDETFSNVNIFDDKIIFLLKEFYSPLSSSHATKYYKYYLGDAVQYKGVPCTIINFTPFNPKDPGFSGRLWVTSDGNNTVLKAQLSVPKDNSFNYIKQLLINQEFEKQANGLWAQSYESMTVKFNGFKVIYDIYAKRETFFADYHSINASDIAFQFPEETVFLKDSEHRADSFWVASRPIPMKEKSQSVKEAEESFNRSPLFKTAVFVTTILTSGYVHTGTKDKNLFDIGPVGTFFSVNEIEGMRLKLGGETTSNLSKYFYLKGFGAYGTKDSKFKYEGTGTWSINGKHPDHDYGIHTLSFTYHYDVNTPGEQFFFTNKDNVLLSFKHSKDDLMTYQRKGILTYEKENDNGLTVKLWTEFQNEKAAGSLQFLTADAQGNITDVGNYNSSEIGIRLRYAHNTIFYQRRSMRVPVIRNAPVFYLTYAQGINGYLNGEYNYSFTEFAVSKLFWMSTYGHIECLAKTGWIWGDLPFPLLILPNANQSYSIQPEAYNLLSPIEFINDKYVSLDAVFHFNGVLFNRIPILERYNLREVASFKGLYGGLSDNNLPENNRSLFLFPENSGTMGKDPYMEASIGIENIFKMLRIDYVRRLTYLHNPNISRGGIRFALRFAF